jgi:hypothetical protein
MHRRSWDNGVDSLGREPSVWRRPDRDEQAILDTAAGHGILKVAKLLGVESGTVQREIGLDRNKRAVLNCVHSLLGWQPSSRPATRRHRVEDYGSVMGPRRAHTQVT